MTLETWISHTKYFWKHFWNYTEIVKNHSGAHLTHLLWPLPSILMRFQSIHFRWGNKSIRNLHKKLTQYPGCINRHVLEWSIMGIMRHLINSQVIMLAELCACKCVLVLVTMVVCKCLDYTSIFVQAGEDVHYRAERKSEFFTHCGSISLVLSWFITVWWVTDA